MKTLLVMTVGQTDVQLVVDDQRHELSRKYCGELHDALEHRGFVIVDAPKKKQTDNHLEKFPEGELSVCTPKLDAVLRFFSDILPIHALVFDTRRKTQSDPRLAGQVVERRLKERGVQADCCTFLNGNEWLEDRLLEDRSNEIDTVVRRDIVKRLNSAISQKLDETNFDHIVIAATGGLPAVNDVVEELVRLHAVGRAQVTSLEVPDGTFAAQADGAVEEKFHPAAGFRARWHALSLIEKGNLLGAWGAVSHLENEPGQNWTRVVKWLAHFASSLPIPKGCDLPVLSHQRMAVRAALRVELALRAEDIARAVQGTVAFFEAALWDKLLEHFERDAQDARWLKLRIGATAPADKLLREGVDDDKNRPFESKSRADGQSWFWFHESGAGRFARDYVKSQPLKALHDAVAKVKQLRNDVAHNEPTPELMNEARTRMQTVQLWSHNDTFLSQPLVQDVLKDLGEQCPDQLCINLVSTVRERLLAIP